MSRPLPWSLAEEGDALTEVVDDCLEEEAVLARPRSPRRMVFNEDGDPPDLYDRVMQHLDGDF